MRRVKAGGRQRHEQRPAGPGHDKGKTAPDGRTSQRVGELAQAACFASPRMGGEAEGQQKQSGGVPMCRKSQAAKESRHHREHRENPPVSDQAEFCPDQADHRPFLHKECGASARPVAGAGRRTGGDAALAARLLRPHAAVEKTRQQLRTRLRSGPS